MHKWLDLIKFLAPAILATIPNVPPTLIPVIVHGITVAEQIPGATGAQKKASVIDLVTTGLNTAVASGASLGGLDVATTIAAVSSGIDATVGAVNAVHSVTK